MKKSIIPGITPDKCAYCGRNGSTDPLECHHVLFGVNRKKADEDGLIVWLCGDRCHRNGPHAVHKDAYTATLFKQLGQMAYEVNHSREEFIQRYGKNYLNRED